MNRKSNQFSILLFLAALLIAMPMAGFAQGQKPSKSRKNPAAKQQSSPESVKPDADQRPEQSEARKAGEEKPDDENKPRDPMSTATFNGLRLRSIGPAFTSGRVIGLAVDPNNPSHYFVAAASGGVWKTLNAGTTWTPVFDREGSYSIGCIVLDPKNPLTVWVGTGENNSQRSVSYGNGVYRSDDGGKSWKNVGLRTSEHIGRIAIDPKDSNIVYVAAQGPLWGPGGERGLYKTIDGGKTWKQIRKISGDTGVTNVAIDPANPDVLLASAWQR